MRALFPTGVAGPRLRVPAGPPADAHQSTNVPVYISLYLLTCFTHLSVSRHCSKAGTGARIQGGLGNATALPTLGGRPVANPTSA